MKRISTVVLAAVLMMGMSASALAGPGCGKHKVRATSIAELTETGKADSAIIDEAVARVMQMMPKMTYKVGDVETCCAKTAALAAAKSETPMQYIVAGQTYASRETAMNKLAEAMHAELPKVARVVHVVDGESLHCAKSAAKLAADKNCAVKHMVAGVEFGCDKSAATVADRLAAKLAECKGCAKSFAASTAPSTSASTSSGCAKSCAKTASATKSGGCSKSKADAATASAKSAGCCSKAKGAAATASAKKSGCCSKKAKSAEATAQTASVEEAVEVVASADETPQLANAKLLVREIVEFVAASRAS